MEGKLMATKYTYSKDNDFPNRVINLSTLTEAINDAGFSQNLDHINVSGDNCDIWFVESILSGEITTLDGIVAAHTGEFPEEVVPPVMNDGRPIVRADTRPMDTSTFFTMAGDTASGIGDGVELRWDFSDPSYTVISGSATLSNGFEIPEGYKGIVFDLTFLDPVYFKDGTIYHFDSPWGQYAAMDIVVPAGSYYPNDHGNIPASALGLSGSQMYSYASTDQIYYRYVNKHYMYG